MIKSTSYRTASGLMITLGVVHTLYFIVSVLTEEAVIYGTLSNVIKKGTVWFLGERSLLSYYNGYSLAMGLLLICYGWLTLLAPRTRPITLLSIGASFTAFIISIVYFHLLAYTLMGLSFFFYTLSLLIKEEEEIEEEKDMIVSEQCAIHTENKGEEEHRNL